MIGKGDRDSYVGNRKREALYPQEICEYNNGKVTVNEKVGSYSDQGKRDQALGKRETKLSALTLVFLLRQIEDPIEE